MINKYKEALDNILKDNPQIQSSTSDIHEDISTLMKLIDKENAKKPKTIKHKNFYGSEWVCPNCKSHIAYFDELGIGTVPAIKYCRECGQKLKLYDE